VLQGERESDLPVGLQAAYAAVAAVEDYPRWQSLVDHVEVLERDADDRPLLVSTALDAGVATLRLVLRYAYEPPHAVRFELERGDVRDLRGDWRLSGDDDATRASYRVEVDPGFKLGLLVRGGVADRLRAKVVDGTLEDLRRHLAGGG
jgi:ribosome-associated toxin RatA of RatAB toxin-antitoxin module